jgi:hypothetical protein
MTESAIGTFERYTGMTGREAVERAALAFLAADLYLVVAHFIQVLLLVFNLLPMRGGFAAASWVNVVLAVAFALYLFAAGVDVVAIVAFVVATPLLWFALDLPVIKGAFLLALRPSNIVLLWLVNLVITGAFAFIAWNTREGHAAPGIPVRVLAVAAAAVAALWYPVSLAVGALTKLSPQMFSLVSGVAIQAGLALIVVVPVYLALKAGWVALGGKP